MESKCRIRYLCTDLSLHLACTAYLLLSTDTIFFCFFKCSTKQSVSGVKTRHLVDITKELSQAIRIHKQMGSHLGGVHFELTGDRVTECVGGSMELLDAELLDRYETHCDPRLNYEQALDMAFLIARYQEKQRGFSGMMSL